jgi:hypothetical protein
MGKEKREEKDGKVLKRKKTKRRWVEWVWKGGQR